MESVILFMATSPVNHQTLTLSISDAIIYVLLYTIWSPIESLLVGNPDLQIQHISVFATRYKQQYVNKNSIITAPNYSDLFLIQYQCPG